MPRKPMPRMPMLRMPTPPKPHWKRGVTADAALDLVKALGTTAKLRINLQATYDLESGSEAPQGGVGSLQV